MSLGRLSISAFDVLTHRRCSIAIVAHSEIENPYQRLVIDYFEAKWRIAENK